jgi:hypothetical protein
MSAPRWQRRLLIGLLMVAGYWIIVEGSAVTMRARIGQSLEEADRVEVRLAGDSTLLVKQITDRGAILRIHAYVDARSRSGGWTRPWHTPQAPHVHATFYRGSDRVGWFAAGKSFFQAPSLDGSMATQKADPTELETLNRLLGVPPGSHLGPLAGPSGSTNGARRAGPSAGASREIRE